MLDMQDKFELPKNVKQIGRGDNFLKVYIEDYAYTYLRQYGKQSSQKDKYCVLVGKIYKNQIEKIVVVKGVIRCNLKNSAEDTTMMSDRVKIFIEDEQKKYYPEHEIVGWMHATSEDIKKIFEYDNIFHRVNFIGNYKILYMLDYENEIEEVQSFRENGLNKLQGFYVYYDKNREMQNYMLDNKVDGDMGTKSLSDFKNKRPDNELDTNVRKYQVVNQSKMLASLSFTLLVMCIIMGFGVVKSLEKINDVESKVTFLNEGYVMLQEKIRNPEDAVQVMNNNGENGYNENSNISQQSESDYLNNADEEVAAATKNAEKKYTKYIVKKGDNLNKISFIHFNTTSKAKAIMEANKLSIADKIYEGQELTIPME